MSRNKSKLVSYDVHHLLPKSKWWSNCPNNLVTMRRNKHEALHILFDNNGFKESLIELFLLWEKCLKDWKIKEMLRECLQWLEYKNGVSKGVQPPERVQGKE